jgi:hypothetical protein
MDNPEKLATLGTQNKRRKQAEQSTQHNTQTLISIVQPYEG